MLQVKSVTEGFELKGGAQKLILDATTVRLDTTVINRPGEYEAAGVEVVYGQTAALVIWDNLQIVFIFSLDKTTQFESAQFTPCDVVLFSAALPKLTKAEFNEILESFDPRVVVMSDKTDRTEIESITKVEPVEIGKLASQTLPEEGREFIILG